MITFRECRDEDIDAILETDRAAFADPWHRPLYEGEFDKDYAYYCAAECDGVFAGFAGTWNLYETAELVKIAVKPRYRRCGIAYALMENVLRKAAELKCERMTLEVRSDNYAAQELYKKHGFERISVRKGYYDGKYDAVIMEKML